MGNLCNKTTENINRTNQTSQTKISEKKQVDQSVKKKEEDLIKKKEEEMNKKNLELYSIQGMIKKETEEILPLNNDLQIFVKNFAEFEENIMISINNKQLDPHNSEYDNEIYSEKAKSDDLLDLLKLKKEHLLDIEGRINDIKNKLKSHETETNKGSDSLVSRTFASFDILENELDNSKNMLHSIDKSKKNIDRVCDDIKSQSITKVTRFE